MVTIKKFIEKFETYPALGVIVVRWTYKTPIDASVYELRVLHAVNSTANVVSSIEATGKMYVTLPAPDWYEFYTRDNFITLELVELKSGDTDRLEWQPVRTPPKEVFAYLQDVVKKQIAGGRATVAFLYKLRHGGAYCPRCYNFSLKAPTDPNCPVCLGTGFEGGYFDPVEIKVSIVSQPQKAHTQNVANWKMRGWGLMTDASHPITENDVMYLPLLGVWVKVGGVTERRYLVYPILQQVGASELTPDHVIAKHLPVPSFSVEFPQVAPRARWTT